MIIVEGLAEIARRGQREGTVAQEADPEQIAWMIMSRSWTEDVAALMGLTQYWTSARSCDMLEGLRIDSSIRRGGPASETRHAARAEGTPERSSRPKLRCEGLRLVLYLDVWSSRIADYSHVVEGYCDLLRHCPPHNGVL